MTPIQITITIKIQAYIITVKIKKKYSSRLSTIRYSASTIQPPSHKWNHYQYHNPLKINHDGYLLGNKKTKNIFFFSPNTIATRSDHVGTLTYAAHAVTTAKLPEVTDTPT